MVYVDKMIGGTREASSPTWADENVPSVPIMPSNQNNRRCSCVPRRVLESARRKSSKLFELPVTVGELVLATTAGWKRSLDETLTDEAMFGEEDKRFDRGGELARLLGGGAVMVTRRVGGGECAS